MRMEVTNVRLKKVDANGRMKAIATITFDEEFVVHDIRVIEGNEGLFVAMPSKRTPAGEFRDVAHPINSGTRLKIEQAVLNAFALAEEKEEEIETENIREEIKI